MDDTQANPTQDPVAPVEPTEPTAPAAGNDQWPQPAAPVDGTDAPAAPVEPTAPEAPAPAEGGTDQGTGTV